MKTVGYIRVSTEDQRDHGVSLEAQEEKIKMYCQLNGLELSDIVSDTGSGKSTEKRLGLQQILDLIADKKINNVVVIKIDRLTRSTIDLLNLVKYFKKYDVNFHSVNEKIDTATAQGNFFITLQGALATMERDLISERTSFALQHKKSKGEVYGNIPFGYRAEDGMLVPDDREQEILQRMKELRASGLSLRKIGSKLEEKYCNRKGNYKWDVKVIHKLITAA